MSKTPTKLVKNGHVIETTYAPEVVRLQAQGYTEVPREQGPALGYDNGGELTAGATEISNTTGDPEYVLITPKASAKAAAKPIR